MASLILSGESPVPSEHNPPLLNERRVEWLIILLCIREILGSNLGPRIGYPEVFHTFLSPSRQMLGYYLKIKMRLPPSTPFQFIVFIYLQFLGRYKII